jgi:hypothetical protein
MIAPAILNGRFVLTANYFGLPPNLLAQPAHQALAVGEAAHRCPFQVAVRSAMECSIDFVAIATAIGTAAYAALSLDYVALETFGLPLQLVCRGAVLAALIIGLFIAIEFLSRKLKKID